MAVGVTGAAAAAAAMIAPAAPAAAAMIAPAAPAAAAAVAVAGEASLASKAFVVLSTTSVTVPLSVIVVAGVALLIIASVAIYQICKNNRLQLLNEEVVGSNSLLTVQNQNNKVRYANLLGMHTTLSKDYMKLQDVNKKLGCANTKLGAANKELEGRVAVLEKEKMDVAVVQAEEVFIEAKDVFMMIKATAPNLTVDKQFITQRFAALSSTSPQ
jgi:hypothetical protein